MNIFNLNQLANTVLASDMYQGEHSTSRVQHILDIAFLKLGLVALAGDSEVSILLDNGFRWVCKVEEDPVLNPVSKGRLEAAHKRKSDDFLVASVEDCRKGTRT